MTDAPLKPCPTPWCVKSRPQHVNGAIKGCNRLRCITCGVETPTYSTRVEAITAWNTRPDPAPTGEVTQGDREAAAALIVAAPIVENPGIIRFRGADDGGFVQAFRNHRLRSVAPLEAENARLREALSSIVAFETIPIMDYLETHERLEVSVGEMKEIARLALSPDGDASEGGGL
ncbi:MAG: hypothetical protein J7496_08755 [Novosphingobium sp.]|nr:hypothetical protein [Novosphingobium sp.]